MDNLESILAQIHDEAARLLLERIRDKTATASDIARAIDLLKMSGITGNAAHKESPLGDLADVVPLFEPSADFGS